MTSDIRDQLQATLGAAYTLERELGGGGMSRVFLADETSLRRKVVVKVLPPELTAGVNVERFKREIVLAAGLQHPHIVPVLAAGETNGLPYYTMPFVDGESLRVRLFRSGPLPITAAIGILRDVAKALAYAHERGIVHRDIKPDNVLLSGGSATVTDFGIAKAISAARTDAPGGTLTQVGTSIGTPTYMAPEQAAADPTMDHRADLYSFGCLAYEVLAGRPPFTDTAPRRLLAAHMAEKPAPILDLRPDTPSVLAELVMRCLEKEADNRPGSAADLVNVLEAVTSGGTQPAAPMILLGGAGMLRKALTVYVIAFVAVAILARAAIVGIGLPAWVFPGALIVMGLGLPVILFTAYVQRVARRALTATPTFTPGGTPSMAKGTMATIAIKASPHVSWRRAATGGVWALGAFALAVAAFMTLRAMGVGPFGALLASGRLDRSDQILLADLRALNTDSTLGRVVSDAVRQALSESSAISLVDPATVSEALRRMERSPSATLDSVLARDVAEREGYKAVITGEVAGVGANGYIVTLRLLEAASGTQMAQFRAAGEGSQGLIDAADKAARSLRARVGENLRRINATPRLAEVTTGSIDALRKYGEAFRANSGGNSRGAVDLAREAVELDSNFAVAWRILGISMTNSGLAGAQSESAFVRAYALRNRVTDRERFWINTNYYRSTRHRDRVRAVAAAESGLALGGAIDSMVFGNYVGLDLVSRQEFLRADSAFELATRSSQTGTFPWTNRVIALVSAGHTVDAERAARLALERFPTLPRARERVHEVDYHLGRLDVMRRAADSLASAAQGALKAWALDRLGEFALRDGRPTEAARRRAEADRVNRERGVTVNPLATELDAAAIDRFVLGNAETAVRRLDAALSAMPLRELPYTFNLLDGDVAIAYARFGHPDKARAVVAGYERTITDSALRRIHEPEMERAAAEIALAELRYDDALAGFRRGSMLPDGPVNACTICLPLSLGRVFDAAGQADSAIVMYEAYLSTPHFNRFQLGFDPIVLPWIRQRLGELHASLGNTAKALEHYRAFVELWANAEPALQPRVADIRRRIAALDPGE